MRILLIIAERRGTEIVSRGLRAEGYAVDLAESGDLGWTMADNCDYDLVILDLGLPEIDGLELLRRIRARRLSTLILVLAAQDGTAGQAESFEAGSDDYLAKPFVIEELVVRLKALLRRGRPNPNMVIGVGDLEIDRLTKRVTRGAQRIELTPKEFSLLEYLASHPDRVISRTMIVEHVWDQSFDGLTNLVDVYMRHLREKIDDPFPVKLIQTVRGAGYKLSPEGAASE